MSGELRLALGEGPPPRDRRFLALVARRPDGSSDFGPGHPVGGWHTLGAELDPPVYGGRARPPGEAVFFVGFPRCEEYGEVGENEILAWAELPPAE